MIKEAIILSGGLGTRLRTVVADKPKCMAPVNGLPFLQYLISYLQTEGIQKFIFSVGYLHEMVEAYLKNNLPDLNYQLSLEEEPLGTGGGVQLACNKATEKNVLICNGDTLFKINVADLSTFHHQSGAACTVTLKPMNDFDRYGAVTLNEDGSIKSFREKQFYKSGLINGGVYALDVERFLKEGLPEKFSFEKNYLENNVSQGENNPKLFGQVQDSYFIDIGIPEDYERAQNELKMKNDPECFREKNLNLESIDASWTLFLDRDGVINDEKHQDYIHTWDEFTFYDGVKEAMSIFHKKFGKIIMVTNQRGIARGLTKIEDLEIIHSNMLKEIEASNGRIDKIYFCPDMEGPNRKPNPGMGLMAIRDFPEINLSKSIMIGNTLSDMKFGRNLGVAINIFLPTTRKEVDWNDENIDRVFENLLSFARAL